MDEYEPITGELRKAFVVSSEIARLDGDVIMKYMTIAKSELDDLCDNIDSVHAHLERDYKTACEVNERQDADYVDLKHENARLREKVRRQGVQLTEVQGALERRNNGELKRHWQKELDRLKAERDSMAAALDAAQGEHAFAPESHYMMLPKDADGVPIHVGDVMKHPACVDTAIVCGIGHNTFFTRDNHGEFYRHPASTYVHYHVPDTWERIVQDAIDGLCDEDELVARCKALVGEK